MPSTIFQRLQLLAGVSLLATTQILAPVVAVPAAAQDNTQGSNVGTEEIIVSARRRDESLQDVPIAVTAFSGAQLEKIAVQDITEIGKFSPNVTLEVSRGTNTTLTAFIRGVGQQDPVAGFEAGVGVYIDDVYLNRPQAAVLDVFDVERIEVLRGPQGTLYGRNTIGGAIKYVTKRLGDEPELKIRGSIGSYEQIDAVVTATIPLTETLRFGASVASLNRDGFGDNLVQPGVENYNKDVLAARATLEYTPNDQWFVRLTGDYLEDDSDARQGHRLIPSTSGDPVLGDVFDTRAGITGIPQSVEAGGGSLTTEYAATDKLTFKNILAYREDYSSTPIDFDSLPAADLDVPAVYDNKQLSEEFQILYEDDNVAGIFGVYYLDASAFTAFDVLLATTGDLIGLPGLNATTLGDVDTETWAVFTDIDIDITDQISLSVGGRYTEDKRTSTIFRQTLIGGFSPRFGGTAIAIATTSDFTGTETFKDFTPRASLSYQPTDEHSFYFSFSQGFKGGGFDPRGQSTATPDFDGNGTVSDSEIFDFLSFDPEQVETFELGWKASLYDGRLNFSVAGFLSDYTDVQIPGSVGVDANGDGVFESFVGITSNAGAATINGIEFEGNALLSQDLSGAGDSLNLAWTMGYLDAEYDVFIDAFGTDVSDERVFQNTPDWTASGSLAYERPVSIGGMDGSISLINSVAYRSQASQFEVPNPFLDQPGFALWDASLIWETDDGKYQVGVHAKNITDKEYIVAGYNFVTPELQPTLGLERTLTGFFGNPRTITATFQAKF